MSIFSVLEKRMNVFEKTDPSTTVREELTVPDISILKIRDFFMEYGTILEYREKAGLCIGTIKSGVGKKNSALTGVWIHESVLYVVSYGKEGIIHQNTARKAVEAMKNYLLPPKQENIKQSKLMSDKKFIIPLIVLLILVGCVIFSYQYSLYQYKQHISFYNQTAEEYNEVCEEYKNVRNLTVLDNIEGIPQIEDPLSIKKEDPGFGSFVQGKLSVKKLKAEMKQITEKTDDLLYTLLLAQQITEPDEIWVMEHLKNIEGIEEAAPVTYQNDPNKLLGAMGGYTSCIYFSMEQLNVPGENSIDKGTDGGGAVEVFQTAEDAKNRCEYLKQFDNTLLYSGSYAVLGTMVIRTSYLLNNEEQIELTDKITREFTKM